jgi:asparagine synthase (glutamine-hydrolysing)
MNEALIHRGPDMSGIRQFDGCILGHRRLSILDLSESARQPMVSPDGSLALVFNGEIYNFLLLRASLEKKGHIFRTTSDSEILLALYQEKQERMLDDLNGMFSFAIWDVERRRLFMARDRLGKKPLYYHLTDHRMSFSSELFSLIQDAQVPRSLSQKALLEYLLYDFVPAPHSIFTGIYKLPAAHMAFFDQHGMNLKRYWQPPLPEHDQDYEEAKETLADLLTDAVRLRLISDVPLGAFLSGGIDSSLVAALMTQSSRERIKTFSVTFPGTSHDESIWSQQAAAHLGTDHHEYPSRLNVEEIFPLLVRHFGEPFGDSSSLPTWQLCRLTRTEVTVALSGDGGDELFGGYDRYLARRLQIIYDFLPAAFRRKIFEPLLAMIPETTDYYGTSLVKQLKLFVRAASRMAEHPLAVVPRTFTSREVERLTGLGYEPETDPVIAVARQYTQLDPVNNMMLTDIQTYLSEDILTKVDRMSMAHALEVRCPLLDHRVVDLACRMPLRFKLRGRTSKRILREVAAPHVPPEILKRIKYGFQIPLGQWLKGSLNNWARDRLLCFSHDFLNRGFVEEIWRDHQCGKNDHAHKIWLILIFNEWYDRVFKTS